MTAAEPAPLPWLERERRGRALGHRALYLSSCASTQIEAQRLAREGAAHGTVVVAGRQTAGKGRSGRPWLSEEGGLYLSLLLRPRLSPDKLPRLTLLAGAAVVDALVTAGADVYAKWPNDVLIPADSDGPYGRYRKVCGVLVEGITGAKGVEGAVLGLGLNLARPAGGFPGELTPVAGALSDQGLAFSRDDALRSLLDELEGRLLDPDDDKAFAAALDVLRARSCTVGRRVEVRDDNVRGVASEIAADGALVVKTDAGAMVRVVAGDVWPRA